MNSEKYEALKRAELAARARVERAEERLGVARAAERVAYEARVAAGFDLERQSAKRRQR